MRALMRRMEALGETQPLMRTLQLSTIANAQRKVPRRSGFLQRNIVPGEVSETSAVVKARTPYAAAIEFGRKAIDIVPRKARVLAWGGARTLTGRLRSGARPTNFAMRVHQPARKAQPYLIPGAEEAVKDVGAVVVKTWNEAA